MDRRTFNKLAGVAGIGAFGQIRQLSGLKMLNQAQGSDEQAAQTGASRPWGNYLFGTAYYPEWWEPSEWEIDFREMQELGINAVRMGEFAWGVYEPASGKFDFAWMDHAISVANHHGVSVILGTPTASVPPWLYQAHPDVLSGNDAGLYTYGGRKGYCTSSSNYLAASASIVSALAEHYGRHPGVIGWQLDNEPGFPFEAYDPVTKQAFQAWLQKRYETLDALNKAWNGAFWSNNYSDWSQIDIPHNSAEGGWQPAIALAYRQFYSDSFLNHLRRQAEIIRKSSKDQFIFTNWPSPAWSVDVFAAARDFLDATAWDNYVSAPGLSPIQRQYIAGYNHDFCRGAGPNQRFLCAEQIAYLPPNAPKQGLRLQAYINLAHGSHGHLYFEWRRPLAGNEQYRPSFIKNFDGTINPEKPIFEETSKEFAHLGPRLATAKTRSDIALLFDFTNQWGQGFGPVGEKAERYGEIGNYYNGFKVLQRNIDIVPLSTDFSQYKLIVASNLRLIDDSTAKRLHAFVAAGGTLVLNYRAGTQNMDCSMRRELPPGVFTDMVGARAQSKLDLVEYSSFIGKDELGITFSGNTTVFRPRTILEDLTLRGAEPIATFRGGRMAGQPAVLSNQFGLGWVIYVGTDSDDVGLYESVARAAGAKANLEPLIPAPYGVEVVSRETDDTVFYFLLNLTESTFSGIRLPRPMDDAISGDAHVTQVSLGPLDVAVLAAAKSGGNVSRTS